MARPRDPRIGQWFLTPNGPALVRGADRGKLKIEYLNGEIDDAFAAGAKLEIIENIDTITELARENPKHVGNSFKWMLLT
jgi:hypothetical protein